VASRPRPLRTTEKDSLPQLNVRVPLSLRRAIKRKAHDNGLLMEDIHGSTGQVVELTPLRY